MQPPFAGAKQLSSRATPLFRFGVPAFWTFVALSIAVDVYSNSPAQALLALLVGAVGLAWYRSTAFRLCHVLATPEGLRVSRGSLSSFIPYSGIRAARHSHFLGFSEVLLHEASAFGTVVLFLPYFAQLFPYQGEHPADLFIQQHLAATARPGGA